MIGPNWGQFTRVGGVMSYWIFGLSEQHICLKPCAGLGGRYTCSAWKKADEEERWRLNAWYKEIISGALELCVLTSRLAFKSRNKVSLSPRSALVFSPDTGTEWSIYLGPGTIPERPASTAVCRLRRAVSC